MENHIIDFSRACGTGIDSKCYGEKGDVSGDSVARHNDLGGSAAAVDEYDAFMASIA